MKIETSPGTLICTGLCVACAAITGVAQVSQDLQSGRAEEGRTKALTVITQHVISDSCMRVSGEGSFKIGDEIGLDGDGKSPTACFVNKKGQLGFAGYLNGKFQVIYVFTPKEVQAKKSQLFSKE